MGLISSRCKNLRLEIAALRSSSKNVGMDDVAAPIASMRIYNAPQTMLCNRTAITPRPTGSTELVSDDFPVLHVARPSQAKSIYEQ
jgi:hypothetical protein